jgi:N-acetylglutamate synthase-like GNAT family acetyltransferase
MYQLRPACPADAPAIRTLVYQARLNPMGLKWQAFVVAESAQGQVIGCGQIRQRRAGVCELASIVVHPDWRLRGVARAIIERLLADQSGPIYLLCRAELGAFYIRFDFRVVEEANMPAYFRHISRMFRWWARIRRSSPGLLVMKRP